MEHEFLIGILSKSHKMCKSMQKTFKQKSLLRGLQTRKKSKQLCYVFFFQKFLASSPEDHFWEKHFVEGS